MSSNPASPTICLLEWITGGGLCGTSLPPSLLREGRMMRDKLLADLLALGHTVTLPLDPRAPLPDLPKGVGRGTLAPILLPDDQTAAHARLAELAATSDWFLPVGPEGEPALANLYRLALANERVLLGVAPAALELTADKLLCAATLKEAGIAVPETVAAEEGRPVTDPAVLKPRFGAGCLDTILLRDGPVPPITEDMILQPLIEGVPLSLTLLCADGQAWLLTVNRQLVRLEGERFVFDGLIVGGAERYRESMETLVSSIAAAIPGLFGLIGVDLIQTVTGPVVIEINPRPTTAYAALGDALDENPMALLLALREQPLSHLRRAISVQPQTVRVDD